MLPFLFLLLLTGIYGTTEQHADRTALIVRQTNP